MVFLQMNVQAAAPIAYAVTATGSYCQGGLGLPVGVANSETGVTYTLIKNAVPGTTLPGTTGSPIDFGNQLFGTYTVSGTNVDGTTTMTGSAIISVSALPDATIAGGKLTCNGSYTDLTVTVTDPLVYWNFSVKVDDRVNPPTIETAKYSAPPYTYTVHPSVTTIYTLVDACNSNAPGSTTTVTVGDNTWTGASTSWDDLANWSCGAYPTSAMNVTIPTGLTNYPVATATNPRCNNLTIASGATVTIPSGMYLTVNGDLINNNAAGVVGVIIGSDATGTGSLIIKGSAGGTGTTVADRWMTAGKWYLVSSPLSGQLVSDFLVANTNIPTKPVGRGMMDYRPSTNSWNGFFADATDYGSLGAGKGFAMRVGASDAAVIFTGSLQAGALSVPCTADSWNCIGNLYTSAIGINSLSSSVAKFMDVNAANLDPAFGAIYLWEKPDINNGQAGNYTAYDNASAAFEVQQGQAFFVKMNTSATSISINPDMQIHNTGLALKSAKSPWPTIKLETTVGTQKSSTIIAFNSGMTKGLDPTYDAGLFKGTSDLIVYSKLVEDNGIPFAIQALPDNGFSTMIIPIGLDFKTGGEVVFSAELLNLPTDCKVILEDKVTKTFTDLSKDNYKAAIVANSVITDRFQLHTSDQTISGVLDNQILVGSLNAYAIKNIEIRVVGEVGKDAVATLYDVQGKAVLVKILDEGSLNIIPTSNIKIGIYVLSVKDNGKLQTFKLLIKE